MLPNDPRLRPAFLGNAVNFSLFAGGPLFQLFRLACLSRQTACGCVKFSTRRLVRPFSSSRQGERASEGVAPTACSPSPGPTPIRGRGIGGGASQPRLNTSCRPRRSLAGLSPLSTACLRAPSRRWCRSVFCARQKSPGNPAKPFRGFRGTHPDIFTPAVSSSARAASQAARLVGPRRSLASASDEQ
jgi:hypothetical protein